jgi:hypothetical protein
VGGGDVAFPPPLSLISSDPSPRNPHPVHRSEEEGGGLDNEKRCWLCGVTVWVLQLLRIISLKKIIILLLLLLLVLFNERVVSLSPSIPSSLQLLLLGPSYSRNEQEPGVQQERASRKGA